MTTTYDKKAHYRQKASKTKDEHTITFYKRDKIYMLVYFFDITIRLLI